MLIENSERQTDHCAKEHAGSSRRGLISVGSLPCCCSARLSVRITRSCKCCLCTPPSPFGEYNPLSQSPLSISRVSPPSRHLPSTSTTPDKHSELDLLRQMTIPEARRRAKQVEAFQCTNLGKCTLFLPQFLCPFAHRGLRLRSFLPCFLEIGQTLVCGLTYPKTETRISIYLALDVVTFNCIGRFVQPSYPFLS